MKIRKVDGFKIEKGVSLPQPRVTARYPVDALKKGESFVVASHREAKNIRQLIYQRKCKGKKVPKLTIRKMLKGSGYRVWRVE